ncbi:hypothetical protein ACQ4M4_08630 [Leptolyngbya sp. AN02str]|uniref:hypothetical protein n=1 Tax=Leptolyngbya sp. AN02str TaxID=3423363 RepID=UPI003D321A5C
MRNLAIALWFLLPDLHGIGCWLVAALGVEDVDAWQGRSIALKGTHRGNKGDRKGRFKSGRVDQNSGGF